MNNDQQAFDAVIIGLGKTGMSCVRYLIKQGFNVAVVDTRSEPPELLSLKTEFENVSVSLGGIDPALLQMTDQIILSPGVSLETEAVEQALEQGIPVYGDIELFCQKAQAPIIAITGSNGKSTVTTLVAEMIRHAGLSVGVGGNLGTPALELLDAVVPDVYVLELSSFQLETTFSLNAHAAVVLNISPDHMDRYDSLDEYARAKQTIYSGNGLMVINQDDGRVKAMADHSRHSISFSLQKPVGNHFGLMEANNDIYLCKGNRPIIKQSESGIRGKHNIANALAAMALADSVNVPETVMAETLRNFTGLPHRCQLVARFNGIDWYNDSKASNVASCIASIEGLCEQGDIILIAGGDSKRADLSDLAPLISQHVKSVLLLGVDAARLAETIADQVPITFVDDMAAAVDAANKIASNGDLVLLAPACASLDMYADYQQRGDIFSAAVRQLERD